ncbi:MAG: class I SAM-dependent methyltransferase [Minisyncoccota bacterium]
MEKINEEQLRRDMVFHLYGRFSFIKEIINKNRIANEKLKILDVGGRGNLLKQFFPNDAVFYLDPFIDSTDENFIKGDGCAMPLENESFDWVVSTDVFEHIPQEKREDFLNEKIRIAKRGVILVAPFYTPEVAQAEINANENYKLLHNGDDHIWLREHIENGLPDPVNFEQSLKNKNLPFQKLHNNRLFLWQTLLGIEFLIDENHTENTNRYFEDFNYFYNTEVAPYDNQEPSYRKIYFIKKDKVLQNIEVTSKTLDDKLFLKAIKNGIDVVNRIYLENRVSRDQEILKCNETINQKDQELTLVKSSKFWRIRDYYIKIKNFWHG